MTDPQTGAPGRSLIQEHLFQQARENRQQHLTSWAGLARKVRRLPAGEPWPAWSVGETLAVAVLLGDNDRLAAIRDGYTVDEALERLRWDIGVETVDGARAIFAELRMSL